MAMRSSSGVVFRVSLEALDEAEVMARRTRSLPDTTVVYLTLYMESQWIAGYQSYGCVKQLLTFVSACPVTQTSNLI